MSGESASKPSSPGGTGPSGDPWKAFGYLVAGVALYGFAGWALGRWLHAPFLTPLGILAGLGFGMYLVFNEYLRNVPGDSAQAPIDSSGASAGRSTRRDSTSRDSETASTDSISTDSTNTDNPSTENPSTDSTSDRPAREAETPRPDDED